MYFKTEERCKMSSLIFQLRESEKKRDINLKQVEEKKSLETQADVNELENS